MDNVLALHSLQSLAMFTRILHHTKKDAALTGLGFLEYIELNAGIFHLLDAMPL